MELVGQVDGYVLKKNHGGWRWGGDNEVGLE